MNCIICQDLGSEPLQDITSCTCKYKCHNSCWIDYVHSTTKVKCLLCRKDLSIKKTPKTNSALRTEHITISPYSSNLNTIPEESDTQITYQEFVNILSQNNSYQNTIITERETSLGQQSLRQQMYTQQVLQLQRQQSERVPSMTLKQKFLKVVLCLGVIIIIAVIAILII
jgi:hypothetical protein